MGRIRDRRRARTALRLAAAGTLAAVLAGCSHIPGLRPSPSPTAGPADAVNRFLASWTSGHVSDAAALTTSPGDATAALTQVVTALHLTTTPGTGKAGSASVSGGSASVPTSTTLHLPPYGDWTYQGKVDTVRQGSQWKISWDPSAVVPGMRLGDQVVLVAGNPPSRGALLGGNGQPIAGPTALVEVDVTGGPGVDAAATAKALATALPQAGIDANAVASRVAAHPGAKTKVATVREADVAGQLDTVSKIPGVTLFRYTKDLAPTPGFAQPLLGATGPATAAVVAAHPDWGVTVGQTVGLSGLEAVFQPVLGGSAGASVHLVDNAGNPLKVLQTFPTRNGADVKLTIDPTVQAAAEKAMDAMLPAGKVGAFVVVRPSDGAVLAVVDRPYTGFERALQGKYPPGSTFKVVSTLALLANGVTPDTTVPCPASLTIGGVTFHNGSAEKPGVYPFSHDFAISCNTAFVSQRAQVAGGRLEKAAASVGVGVGWRLPGGAYSGAIPRVTDDVQLAGDMFGQGQVLMSPIGMALVSAAVQNGTWRPPVLVTGPADAVALGSSAAGSSPAASGSPGASASATPGSGGSAKPSSSASGKPSTSAKPAALGTAATGDAATVDATTLAAVSASASASGSPVPSASGSAGGGAAGSSVAPVTLDPSVVATTQQLMLGPVRDPAGTAYQAWKGYSGDVHGKTGSAQFIAGNESNTHAWFTGYQGNLAFATFVENGGIGGTTAAPIARRFLELLSAAGYSFQ